MCKSKIKSVSFQYSIGVKMTCLKKKKYKSILFFPCAETCKIKFVYINVSLLLTQPHIICIILLLKFYMYITLKFFKENKPVRKQLNCVVSVLLTLHISTQVMWVELIFSLTFLLAQCSGIPSGNRGEKQSGKELLSDCLSFISLVSADTRHFAVPFLGYNFKLLNNPWLAVIQSQLLNGRVT